MTIRRKCTPRADQTAVFSEAVGTIYPQGTDGPMAEDAVVLAKLREPVIHQVLANLGGVLNTGALFDDAVPSPGEEFPVVAMPNVLVPGAAPLDFSMPPNVVHLFTCAGAGNGSASQEEGGVGMAGGQFYSAPPAVTMSQLPEQGGRAVFPVPVFGGDYLGIMILGDVSRRVRVDIRLP
jgi:hypothetical protein